jgi:hypothetical protein
MIITHKVKEITDITQLLPYLTSLTIHLPWSLSGICRRSFGSFTLFLSHFFGKRLYVYPIGIGFPVFLVTYLDIFYFFLRSLITDKLPKEEKYNLFRIYDPIPKTKFA